MTRAGQAARCTFAGRRWLPWLTFTLAPSSILALIGDKWTVLIVVLLDDGPKRFNEIKRMGGGISQRMLTFSVRGLERDGLVTRTVFPTTPQRAVYELTSLVAPCGRLWNCLVRGRARM